jgi:GT2 family glycosyltransferase
MDISIIIVNFNTDKLVSDCIASIKRNTKKVTYETIVIDNTINNRGFAKANNLGIRKAKGKYILLLNSDTIVGKNSIDKMFEFAENNPDAGAIVPRLYNPNGSIQASCFRLPTIHLAFKQYFLKQGKLLDKYFPRSEKPTIVESAVMAAYLITPEALKKVGKLNEKYFMYFEDIDYSKKINEAGLKIYYLPEAQVVHIHGASGGTNKYLVDSAKKYFGTFNYYIYTFILWLGQKI